MTDTVEKVAERLAQLEKTVAEGFHANTTRFRGLDARLDALNNKIDVSVESLRGDLKTVVEILTAHIDEMRRTTDSIRKEGAADREILKLALLNHERPNSVVGGSRYFFFRAITTSSLPPSAVWPTVIPSAEKPSRARSFSSFWSVDVLDVATSR